MEKKIEGMEAEAEAFSELSGEGPADDPFKSMEKDMQVDDEMAKLLEKMNLGGGANA
jgi:phage shock protein A